jgi:hypothetical protein
MSVDESLSLPDALTGGKIVIEHEIARRNKLYCRFSRL